MTAILNHLSARALLLISPALLVAAWYAVTEAGWYPPELLVPPGVVAASFWELLQTGELQQHLSATLHRLAFGFLIGTGCGLVFGVLAALFKVVEDSTTPLFNAVRQVPSIAFIPILILIFGIGETFKILVVTKASFFPVALATYQGVKGIPQGYFDVGRAYRLPLPHLLTKVVLPATLPTVVTGLRLGLARSWGVLVAAELIAAESGLGQMMEWGRQMFRIDLVMVGVVITGVGGFLLDRILKAVESRLSRWKAA